MQSTLKIASLQTRVVGTLIDYFIILLLIVAEVYLNIRFPWIDTFLPSHSVWYFIIFCLPFLLTPFAYHFLLEYFFSRTIGKMICRTKVVNEDGSKPSAAAICRRTLWRIYIGGPITTVYLFSYYDENGNFTRMNHDARSKTLVIQE